MIIGTANYFLAILYAQSSILRVLPMSKYMAHVLGFTGELSPDIDFLGHSSRYLGHCWVRSDVRTSCFLFSPVTAPPPPPPVLLPSTSRREEEAAGRGQLRRA